MGALTCPTEFAPLERTQESKNLDVQLRESWILESGSEIHAAQSGALWSAASGALNLTHSDSTKNPPPARRLPPPRLLGRWPMAHDTTPRCRGKNLFSGAEDKNSGKSVAQSRNELLTQGINFVV